MEKLLNKYGISFLIALAVISGAFLFFGDQLMLMADSLHLSGTTSVNNSDRVLKIAYLFKPANLNPYNGDSFTQTRLLDVYEGLVRIDENLNIRPGLAVSYGLKNENEWEFTLRNGVKFHNGQLLTADDIIYSFEQAKQGANDAVLIELLSNISEIKEINEQSLVIKTKEADPLFLNRISKLAIIPNNFKDFARPIGTGAYQITDTTDLGQINYTRNDNYWGDQAYFKRVQVLAVPSKEQRINGLFNGGIDVLVDVPPDAVELIKAANIQIKLMPSLEVGFVMFNLNNEELKNRDLRVAIAKSLNKVVFLDAAFGFAKTVNQFVSNGVFGYNPDIQGYPYNQNEARAEISKKVSGFENIKLQFFYPENLKLLGAYFKEQLHFVGIDLELIPLSDQELQERLKKQDMGFYYLGWRSEMGDALPFLKAVVRAKNGDMGIFNGSNYKNDKVEELISQSEHNLNLKDRLKKMQEVMKIIVMDDVMGVPIFETDSIFALIPTLDFQPRVDSLVYPSAIKLK